jgi:hypothetical protein
MASIEIDEMRKTTIGAVAGFRLLGFAERGVGTAIALGTKDGEAAYFTVDAGVAVTGVRAALGRS